MFRNKSEFIIEEAMANIIATVKMLEDCITREKYETRANELRLRRDLLIEVLKELGVDYKSKDQDQSRVA